MKPLNACAYKPSCIGYGQRTLWEISEQGIILFQRLITPVNYLQKTDGEVWQGQSASSCPCC
jgi:hypothetical protein